MRDPSAPGTYSIAVANTVLIGVFLAIYAVNQGYLWGACGWRAAWNWLMASGLGLEVSGGGVRGGAAFVDLASVNAAPWWVTGGSFGVEASVVTTAVLSGACIWALARRAT